MTLLLSHPSEEPEKDYQEPEPERRHFRLLTEDLSPAEDEELASTKSLGDLVEVKGIRLGTNPLHSSSKEEGRETPFIRLADVNVATGEISFRLPKVRVKVREHVFLREGDIIVIAKGRNSGYLGSAFLVPAELAALQVVASSNFAVIRLRRDRLDPEFLCGWLNTESAKRQLPVKSSTSVCFLETKSLGEMQVPCPHWQWQNELAAAFRALREEKLMLTKYSQMRHLKLADWLERALGPKSSGASRKGQSETPDIPELADWLEREREGAPPRDVPLQIAVRLAQLRFSDTLVDPFGSSGMAPLVAGRTRRQWAVGGRDCEGRGKPERLRTGTPQAVETLADVKWCKRQDNKIIADCRGREKWPEEMLEILINFPVGRSVWVVENLDQAGASFLDALRYAGSSKIIRWPQEKLDILVIDSPPSRGLGTEEVKPPFSPNILLQLMENDDGESFLDPLFLGDEATGTDAKEVRWRKSPLADDALSDVFEIAPISDLLKSFDKRISKRIKAHFGGPGALEWMTLNELEPEQCWSPLIYPGLRAILCAPHVPEEIEDEALENLVRRLRWESQFERPEQLEGIFKALCSKLAASLPPLALGVDPPSPWLFATLAAFPLQWFAEAYSGYYSNRPSGSEKGSHYNFKVQDLFDRASAVALSVASDDECVKLAKRLIVPPRRDDPFEPQLRRRPVARKLLPESPGQKPALEGELSYPRAVEKYLNLEVR